MGIPEDILMHYGVKRRSGRYPWGSGDNPYQHSGDFLSRFEELKNQGLSETDIAKVMGFDSTTDLRLEVKLSKHERRELQRARAQSLKDDGLNNSQIAKEMGFPSESSVRALLNENTAANKNKARVAADILKKELESKGMIDVGAGVERELGISEPQLSEAVYILLREGYHQYGVGVPQVQNPSQKTITKVLAKPDIPESYAQQHYGDIKSVGDYYSDDGGSTFRKIQYPASIDSSRVHIRYGDEGGINKDGVIEIRRGVEDLSLGKSNYAQVRILVDGTHYLKGMAMYSNDIPDGCDIVFNTNKQSGTPKEKVFKEITGDPDNPFGAVIKADGQSTYFDISGNEKLSAINKLKEEGDWDAMSKNLSSQFLSKQPKALIQKQLDATYADYEDKFDEICKLTNPTIKREMLNEFANECDGATVHIKAVALPRQKTQVILPLTAMSETEVYAPNYRDGEQVALIRYPHAGTFEIPILTVNNKNKQARDILSPNIKDAIGINPKVAERLSGADFDGDQVVVIPLSDKVRIKSTRALDGLKDFDPKSEYAYREGMKVMAKGSIQKEMGMVSNLITDMTLRGAPESHVVRAVKHSMVVIDAYKHKLDYKRSEKENGIQELREMYQIRVDDDGNIKYGGASTLISRRKQDARVPERQGSARIDKETGELIFKESGRKYRDKDGNLVEAKTVVKLMSVTDDAHSLSSGHVKEEIYADYINKLKALSNRARKEMISTGRLQRNASAAQAYDEEVDSLMSKLNVAAKNAPREREAQRVANTTVRAKVQDNPALEKDKKELKKIRTQAIYDARAALGSSGRNTRIVITDREWEAIQAGAISDTQLTKILRYSDKDALKERAMPRATTQLSTARVNKIKHMANIGYTNEQIAEALGCSVSTVHQYVA
ncbi:MAG: helix-turn-helix domain-containing protein [Oscillospiraceae bacterium]|nr:helix-turn-helix domain-containing protein [Oscillospiraceae bacterium]